MVTLLTAMTDFTGSTSLLVTMFIGFLNQQSFYFQELLIAIDRNTFIYHRSQQNMSSGFNPSVKQEQESAFS